MERVDLAGMPHAKRDEEPFLYSGSVRLGRMSEFALARDRISCFIKLGAAPCAWPLAALGFSANL